MDGWGRRCPLAGEVEQRGAVGEDEGERVAGQRLRPAALKVDGDAEVVVEGGPGPVDGGRRLHKGLLVHHALQRQQQ